jgi:hypothetical protein
MCVTMCRDTSVEISSSLHSPNPRTRERGEGGVAKNECGLQKGAYLHCTKKNIMVIDTVFKQYSFLANFHFKPKYVFFVTQRSHNSKFFIWKQKKVH